ncbi:hypothetical protein CQ018_17880 [Arthrobacter sp. MYb227]|nr:hypothetical protein CQ018_17880 [Arthrobacter sp. MYb227]
MGFGVALGVGFGVALGVGLGVAFTVGLGVGTGLGATKLRTDGDAAEVVGAALVMVSSFFSAAAFSFLSSS